MTTRGLRLVATLTSACLPLAACGEDDEPLDFGDSVAAHGGENPPTGETPPPPSTLFSSCHFSGTLSPSSDPDDDQEYLTPTIPNNCLGGWATLDVTYQVPAGWTGGTWAITGFNYARLPSPAAKCASSSIEIVKQTLVGTTWQTTSSAVHSLLHSNGLCWYPAIIQTSPLPVGSSRRRIRARALDWQGQPGRVGLTGYIFLDP